MKVDGDKPLIENIARGLGVRVGPGRYDDTAMDAAGNVEPGNGMSVSPAWRLLPLHRIPRRLQVPFATGKDEDKCWRMGTGPFEDGPIADKLILSVNRPEHGVIGPSQVMSRDSFIEALIATRDQWTVDED